MTKTKFLGKKIIVIAVAAIMIFAVGLLGACDIDTSWQRDFNALAVEVAVLEQNGNATSEQIADAQGRLDALENRANSNRQREQIQGLQTRITALYNGNGGNPVEHDFILTISVEDNTWVRGQDFILSVELKNNSEQIKEIAAYGLFYPRIEGVPWVFAGSRPPWPTFFSTLESGATIQRNVHIAGFYYIPNSDLSIRAGTYKLHFLASFYLNWAEGNTWEENRSVQIPSNEIKIIVQ